MYICTMKKAVYTQDQIDKVVELYTAGLSPTQIQKVVGFHRGGIRQIARDQGIARNREDANRLNKGVLSIKVDAFDILTPETLYWIGFLYADGHIEKSCNNVTVTVSEKDRGHLEKLNAFMGGHLNIRDVTPKKMIPAPGQVNFGNRYYRIGFRSKQIHDRLKDLGFTHNKTNSIIPHDLLKCSRDFWRGVVDGDGWICKINDNRYESQKNKPSLGLSGTQSTLIEFINFLLLSGITTTVTPSKRKKANVWELNLNGKYGFEAAVLLYKDAPVYLERKYQKYLEFNKGTN